MPGIVIVGAGPASQFCARQLVAAGERDITILEMGVPMTRRWCPETQACDCYSCFVLEGEGGAGGFSDGKMPYSLLRGTQMEDIFDPSLEPLLWDIDSEIVKHGGEGVWYDPLSGEPPGAFAACGLEFSSYPLRHVGSDGIQNFAAGMTKQLQEAGVTFHFRHEVTDLIVEHGVVKGVRARARGVLRQWEQKEIFADRVILATGIQGIPWTENLMQRMGVELLPGPAGIGIRVEAPAADLADLFTAFYDWKVIYEHIPGMTLRSFCCNQRGKVVNQYHKSMPVRNVNGHSFLDPSKRTDSSNFAVVAKIGMEITDDPQAYVRKVAQDVNALTDGHTCVQWAKDFMEGKTPEATRPAWRTNVMSRDRVDISAAMPPMLREAFREFIGRLMSAVPTMDPGRAIVYAPEVKYPAKRVPVDLKTWRLPTIEGLYVLGDATGYVDSFIAAALTGVVAANDITQRVPVG